MERMATQQELILMQMIKAARDAYDQIHKEDQELIEHLNMMELEHLNKAA